MNSNPVFKEWAQKVFNKAYLGLKAQGFERAVESGSCRLKAGDLGCALGQLISADRYRLQYEKLSIKGLVQARVFDEDVQVPDNYHGDPLTVIAFLNDMQRAHDNCRMEDERADMPRRLCLVAEIYALTVPEGP